MLNINWGPVYLESGTADSHVDLPDISYSTKTTLPNDFLQILLRKRQL